MERASAGIETLQHHDPSRPWIPCCPYFRLHSGEPCPETVVLMPFVAFLYLALELRSWLRQQIGQKTGNVVGSIAVVIFGGPPLLLGYVVVLMMRLALTLLLKLETVAR